MPNFLIIIFYLLTTFLSFSIANLIVLDKFWMDGRAYPSLLIASLFATVISYFASNQNAVNATTQVPQLLFKVFGYMIVQSFLILVYWFSVNSINYSKEHIIVFLTLTTLLVFLFNYLYIRYLRKHRIGIPLINSIVLGENRFTNQFIRSLSQNQWIGFDLKNSFNSHEFFQINLDKFVKKQRIGAVFINWDEFNMNKEREFKMRNLTEEFGVKFYAISEVFGKNLLPSSYNLFDNFPYIQLFTFPLDNKFRANLKRMFDVFFSVFFFIFIGSWLFPIIIVLQILFQGFPIFYSQKRHGIDNIEFDCYKFRTMVNNSNNQTTVKNDPRVTKLGRILRKTSLDELPQFWNVLIGDMSIVGPRPHMIEQNFYYNELISKYNFRHYVKPGITGLAQVSGLRGEVKENKDMEDRVQADLYYIRNWSFGLDISIIYRTVANMVKGDKNAI